MACKSVLPRIVLPRCLGEKVSRPRQKFGSLARTLTRLGRHSTPASLLMVVAGSLLLTKRWWRTTVLEVPEWCFVPPLTSSSRRRLSAGEMRVLFAWLMWLMEKYKFHTQVPQQAAVEITVSFSWCGAVERKNKPRTTVNNGYLGSRNDEERSEMRYVMRIAEFSESSNL